MLVACRQAGVAVLVLIAILAAPRARADSALSALVDALAERLEIAEPVAAYKWSAHGDIEDPVRVEQELASLREDAASAQIDPDYVVRVFGDQINATEAIEYRRFADWKLDPGLQPSGADGPADLSASRTAIDMLNTKILSHIALNWNLLHDPACARQLEDARTDAIRVRRFDNLYRQALTTATRSYCQAEKPT
ncbi:MAG: chorismate mutase [Mycobacterium sp.]|nr:chorismate mutase [Mycobacterium sp.]